MPLHALPSSAYQAFLNWAPSPGVEKTHVARLSANGDSVTAYVKAYADKCCSRGYANRGLVNEAIGYLLAEAAGVGVPRSAGLIVLEKAAGAPVDTPTLAWWCEDVGAMTVKAIVNFEALSRDREAVRVAISAAQELLIKQPGIYDLIALDELIANIDRNLGNVLLSPVSMTAIDHGRAITGPCWRGDCLDPTLQYWNTLRDFLGVDAMSMLKGWRNLHSSAAKVAALSRAALPEAKKWSDALVVDSADRAGVDEFLDSRSKPGALPQLFGFVA